MAWTLGAMALVALGVALKWVLRLQKGEASPASRRVSLAPDREAIYQPLALEVETQTAILGISLNDAIEERASGNLEIAWRLVRLTASEWDRLAELIAAILSSLARHLAEAHGLTSMRRLPVHLFKSRTMRDSTRMYELLDQLAFRSKFRFQLHLHVLRRAKENLTSGFRRTYRYGERTGDRGDEVWNRLDPFFHDFDLIAKETLLALRAFLNCVPNPALEAFSADLKASMGRGVRSTVVTTNP